MRPVASVDRLPRRARLRSAPPRGDAYSVRRHERGVRARVHEVSQRFPSQMIFAHNERHKQFFDLYRVDLVTGKSVLVYENNQFAWFVTDSAFQLRLGARYLRDGSIEVLERRPSGTWVPFITIPRGEIEATRLLDFSDDGKTLYLFDARDRDKAALVAVDMATRRARVLAEDRDADLSRAFFHRVTRRPLAGGADMVQLRDKEMPARDQHAVALGRQPPRPGHGRARGGRHRVQRTRLRSQAQPPPAAAAPSAGRERATPPRARNGCSTTGPRVGSARSSRPAGIWWAYRSGRSSRCRSRPWTA